MACLTHADDIDDDNDNVALTKVTVDETMLQVVPDSGFVANVIHPDELETSWQSFSMPADDTSKGPIVFT